MTDSENIILCPHGYGLNISDIRGVTPVSQDSTQYYFSVYFKGLPNDNRHNFCYGFSSYSDSRDDLKVKVENIRMELMTRMNGGKMPQCINNAIKLKKKNG